MERPDALDFRKETAAQQLGQYCAWDINEAHAVDLLWVSKAHAKHPAAHRVLPHGEPSIAIRRRRDARGDITSIDLTICGPFRRAAFYNPQPREELIAVRLKPELAARYYRVSPADFFDSAPANAPREVYDACSASLRAAENWDLKEIIPILISDLVQLAKAREARIPCEAFAAALLRKQQGRIRAKTLATLCGVSERHLRRRFRDCFGATPKEYARQLRLTAAALEAERSIKPNWARIAAASGFHDQSHMINEFKGLVALTPQALHRERRALLHAI